MNKTSPILFLKQQFCGQEHRLSMDMPLETPKQWGTRHQTLRKFAVSHNSAVNLR